MFRMSPRAHQWLTACLSTSLLAAGCAGPNADRAFIGEPDHSYPRYVAEEVSYPAILTEPPQEVVQTLEPHTIRDRGHDALWDLTLSQAMQIALQNNEVIRSAGQFLSTGNTLFTGAERVPSAFDPAIQESGVLFGGRGVEAALAAFDANFTTRMVWGRNEAIQNSSFGAAQGVPSGATSVAETGNFEATLGKTFANGGQFTLGHTVDYFGSNSPAVLFPSVYTGNVSAQYRMPLLAGAGTEYTRIAGPVVQSFGGISGVSQGVVIARINNDITLAQFEGSVRNLLLDVENTYWSLYLAYRNFDTAVEQRNATLETWRVAKITREEGGNIRPADEAQARDQYFAAKAQADTALSTIYTGETRLRRLIGLPVSDGQIIRPIESPTTAEIIPDWYSSLSESLTNRVELRQQKWNIKSLQLQLKAARSLTRPRVDFLGSYQVNGFGDDLIGYDDDDSAGTPQGVDNYYETLTQGNQTGWGLGFEVNVPLGLRQAHAQVRNYELRLAKAMKVLQTQEQEVSQELAVAFQEVTRTQANAKTNFARREAAIENVALLQPIFEEGEITLDELLRAQARRADAESAYFQSIVDYNNALADLQLRKGTLLHYNNVSIAEGPWTQKAYCDAECRAEMRAYAHPNEHLHSEPTDFASSVPAGGVHFTTPAAAAAAERNNRAWAEPVMPETTIEPPPAPTTRPAPTPADEDMTTSQRSLKSLLRFTGRGAKKESTILPVSGSTSTWPR